MISKKKYKKLKERHKKACEDNDYSKMIIIGDKNYKKLREYEAEFICKHLSVKEIQGGQIEECISCGKRWG